MTREEYVNFANALKNNYTIDFDKLPEFCDMAISLLEENNREWIPVTERLPKCEKEVKVIVSYENEDGEFVERGVFNKRYGFNFPSVKAWQLLPETYKVENEDKE